MDLNQFLLYYGELSGRTVLRPTTLPAAQIILKTQTDLTPTEAIQAFDSVLAMNSISMVRVGEKFVKAVPATQVNQEGAPLQRLGDEPLPELGPYVTHVAQLKYARPSEMIQALMPFAKIQNGILAIDSSQILVLRDYTENVKRMLELIKEVDVAIPAEFVSEVIPIKYAMASDIASALSSLSSGGAVTSSGGTGTGGRTATSGRTGTTGAGRFGTTGLQGQPGVNPYGASTPGQPGQPGAQPSFQQRMQDIIKRASTTATGDIQVLGPTKIIADERANALLVFASRQDMQTITNIVAKLDVVLPQVLIETIIMDVSLTDNLEFGVSGVQTTREFGNDFTGAGGVNANKFFNFAGSSATNAVGDLLGSGLRYFGKFNDDVYVTVQAMADKGRVTVIQKPRIMTFHAKAASFFIGSTVPYVTSSFYGGYYGGGPSSQYQQLRVGIGLYVTPYINQDGLVVMEIEQQMEEIDGFTKIENVGEVPNTASKTLTAQVAVKDRETIILGGFIRTLRSKGDSGVPVLKDLPLLGYLFKQVSRKTERKELVVLLRPTVLVTPELASAETLAEKLRLPGVSLAEGEDKITEAEQIEKVKRYLAGEEKKAKRRSLPPE